MLSRLLLALLAIDSRGEHSSLKRNITNVRGLDVIDMTLAMISMLMFSKYFNFFRYTFLQC